MEAPTHGSAPSTPAGLLQALKAYLRRPGNANRRDTGLLLLARIAALNLVGLAGLAAAWAEGWLAMVMAADPDRLCLAIAAVFLAGLGFALRAARRIGADLDAVHAGTLSAVAIPGMDRRLRVRLRTIRHIAATLVILGLLGTVIGFIVALSGVKPEAAGDVKAAAPMISTLISGMSVALYTTLVGAIFNIWLMANHQALYTAAEKLMAALEARDARP